jgi:hypothetical protein
MFRLANARPSYSKKNRNQQGVEAHVQVHLLARHVYPIDQVMVQLDHVINKESIN